MEENYTHLVIDAIAPTFWIYFSIWRFNSVILLMLGDRVCR
jgi:hypothetical protein